MKGVCKQARAVRQVLGAEAAGPAFLSDPTRRWPMLFLAMWSHIHLDGAAPADALAAVAGPI